MPMCVSVCILIKLFWEYSKDHDVIGHVMDPCNEH